MTACTRRQQRRAVIGESVSSVRPQKCDLNEASIVGLGGGLVGSILCAVLAVAFGLLLVLLLLLDEVDASKLQLVEAVAGDHVVPVGEPPIQLFGLRTPAILRSPMALTMSRTVSLLTSSISSFKPSSFQSSLDVLRESAVTSRFVIWPFNSSNE